MNLLIPILLLPPAAALAVTLLSQHRRAVEWLAAATAALTLALCLTASGRAPAMRVPLMGLGLSFEIDGFRAIYCCIAAFMWLASTLYSREYFSPTAAVGRYQCFSLLTLGATLGVFLSADLYTTFLFFELLSLFSYPLVVHEESPAAIRAGGTYLAVAIIGGLALLLGLMMVYNLCGTLETTLLPARASALADRSVLYGAGVLMMVGFGAKAGMFPLHIWLPKAHPVAPAPASALLSGVLTKTGIFGVIIVSRDLFFRDLSWGLAILLPGCITMVWGAILALCSVDLKRTLACSSVSQMGFILVGVGTWLLLGEEGGLAARGTLLHMVNHSALKLVLFLCAGAVYKSLHTLNLNDIRGFGRSRPLFAFCFGMGALGIAGIPLWNGYVSKTLLHEALVEAVHHYHYTALEPLLQGAEYLFLFTGGLTVAYMTKLSVVLFIEKSSEQADHETASFKPAGGALIALTAALLPIMGCFPALMDRIADFGAGFFGDFLPIHAVHYFAWINLKGAVISIGIGAVIYGLVVRRCLLRNGRYIDPIPRWFDLEDRLYRPLLRGAARIGALLAHLCAALPDTLIRGAICAGVFVARLCETLFDGLIRLLLATLLRPRESHPFPGRFYGRFYRLFHPVPTGVREEPTMGSGLSHALLTFGVGLCIVVVFMLFQA